MNNEKLICKVVVGSRLHNLNNEKSDYDYRGIFMHPVEELLSPFKKLKNTSWIEGDEDNTTYELRDFCKMAVHGNPTILEILYSTMVVEDSELYQELKENRHKFLDSERIYEAHKGYAHNQYNKMNLFEPDARTPKFAVAYIRSLIQGEQLLTTGEMKTRFEDDDPVRDFLISVKYNYDPSMNPKLGQKFTEYQMRITQAYYANYEKFKPDIEWIEKFLIKAYLGKNAV